MERGERRVGKTSLANVLSDIFADRKLEHLHSVGVNCTTNDDFRSIWRNVFHELHVDLDDQWADVSPEAVRYVLQGLQHRTLIVIDEVDRLENDEALTLLSDTVKTLSDHSVGATLVLVGVADSVDELIGDHQSIERAVTQVPMPRMSNVELTGIVDKGLRRLRMTITDNAKTRIARLSEGLPHYTHLLSLHATQRAIMDDRSEVRDTDATTAIQTAVQKAQHTIRTAYQRATRSPRQDSLSSECSSRARWRPRTSSATSPPAPFGSR